MNKIGTISWTNIKSAFVSIILTAVLSMAVYVVGLGDVYKIEPRALLNIGSLSLLTGLISLLKSLLTTSKGNFMGMVKVIPNKQ